MLTISDYKSVVIIDQISIINIFQFITRTPYCIDQCQLLMYFLYIIINKLLYNMRYLYDT